MLVFLLLLFFPFGNLFSQADEAGENEEIPAEEPAVPPLEVRIETSSANPTVGSPWALYVLVNHPRASEVNIISPRFPPALVLDRIRTETRLIRKEIPAPEPEAAGGLSEDGAPAEGAPERPATVTISERWTRVEFLFTPRSAGPVSISPFGASAAGREAVTEAFSVRVREAPRTVRRYEPRFRWTGTLSIPHGERGELTLELSNWDPGKLAPQDIFQGRMPLNAIFQEHPPAEAGEGIFRYIIAVIPLEEEDISIESFSFAAEGFSLAVPELRITVLPAPAETGAAPAALAGDESPGEAPPEERNKAPPFPEYREEVFPLFQKEYRLIAGRAKTLWESGRRVEALAEIRRNERDSLSGPFLAPLRCAMEHALGLGLTGDENWRPLRIRLAWWFIFALGVLSLGIFFLAFRPRGAAGRPRLSRKGPGKSVTSGSRSGFRTVIIVALSMSIAFILLDEGLSKILMGNRLLERLNAPAKTAILAETAAYRVPDLSGAVNTRFGEGQPVIVGSYRGGWYHAESPDGRSGWVPGEAVLTY